MKGNDFLTLLFETGGLSNKGEYGFDDCLDQKLPLGSLQQKKEFNPNRAGLLDVA